MSKDPWSDLKTDAISSAVAALPLFLWLYINKDYNIILENIGTFNSTVTTLLGLLFTVLAIIYTFEGQFEENEAVKKLKKAKKYRDVTRIFFYSVGSIGIIWTYTFSLAVFEFYRQFGTRGTMIVSYISILGFALVIIRLWRCFSIFILLNKAIKAYDEDDDSVIEETFL